MGIKKILEKNEKLYYLVYCISKINSKRFRNRVLSIRTNPYCVLFNNNGSLNKDKVFYEIIVGDETKGFCSAIRDTLYYLLYADAMGFIPYIRYTDNIPYHEDHSVNGADNVFEYYFKQPSGVTIDELNHSSKVAQAESVHVQGVFSLYDQKQPDAYYSNDEEIISLCAEVYNKYFVLNECVESKLALDAKKFYGLNLIGVHYRGTDFKVGYNGHPVAVSYKKHIVEAEKLLSTGNYDGIFLATEDGDVIKEFENRFGDKLFLYSDVVRGTGEINAYNVKAKRDNHRYLLGYEVLRDVYTLAMCSAFVTSMSGVGITTQIVKKSQNQSFDNIIMLDEGINKSKKVLQKNKY